jgi:membrane associated rhomboid family serine protease
VVTILLVLNILVFLATADSAFELDDSASEVFAFVPAYFFENPWEEAYSIFTSMFLHANVVHIAMNMIALVLVGKVVEVSIRHGKFTAIYLLSGIGAALIYGFVELATHDGLVYLVGASGAISGIIGASLLLGNKGAILWLGIQVAFAYLTLGDEASSVAFVAHIGGFVCGLVACRLMMRKLQPQHELEHGSRQSSKQ